MAKEMTRASSFDIEVSWAKDHQSVGVATLMPEPKTSNEPQDLPAMIGAAPDGWAGARGLYATLDDRASVNKLIRDLRRARDSAFGKDE